MKTDTDRKKEAFKRIKQEFDVLQLQIDVLATAIKTATRDVIETVKREYEPGRVNNTNCGGGVGIATEYLQNVYDPNEVVPPGEFRTYYFGVDFDEPDSGVPGLPETVKKSFGIWPRALLVKGFEVDDDIAQKFAVTGVYFGANSLWHPGLKVPATRFAATATPIPPLGKVVFPRLVVTVTVENTSETPSTFHMKVLGEEVIEQPLDDVKQAKKVLETIKGALPDFKKDQDA